MTQTTSRPHAPAITPGAGPAWAIIILAALAIVAGGLVWLGGGVATVVTGSAADPWVPFSIDTAISLVTDGWTAVWPGTDRTHMTIGLVVAAAALGPLVYLAAVAYYRLQGRQVDPARRMGDADDKGLAALTPRQGSRRAAALRPSLADNRRLEGADVGLLLGRLRPHGPEMRASWEDVGLAVMAPRAGKTTALAVPAVLDAPGPAIATSNKPDLWQYTVQLRRNHGPVWVFDPQDITGGAATPDWCWDPLSVVRDVEGARRLAGHFVADVDDQSKRDFWISAAEDLLTNLLLAAALDPAATLKDVYRWLSNPKSDRAVAILADHGQDLAAQGVEARQHGAVETRDGIYETARTAASCLRDPSILQWVTRGRHTRHLDLDELVIGTGTLYCMSKDGAGAARPLVAALVDATFRAGVTAAERAGGRLDPPMVAVLDEAANICRIGDLPDLYSHFGSRGITPLTILQSYRQGVRVWGEAGMDTLWSASTIKLVGAGIDDPRLLDDLSRMIGDRDITTESLTYNRDGGSRSYATRKEPIMPPAAIRAMPKGQALLLATGARPALIDLQPWYDSPRADAIAAAAAQARP